MSNFETYKHRPSGWIFRARESRTRAQYMDIVPLVGLTFSMDTEAFLKEFEKVKDVRSLTPLWEATSEEIFEELAKRFDSVALGLEKDNLSDVRISGSFNACYGLAAEIQEVVGLQKGDTNGLNVDG